MNAKQQQNIFHVSVNVNLMEQNRSQVNGGTALIVNVSVKKFMYVKKIMFGILLHAIVKMEYIKHVLLMIQRLSVIKL